MSDGAQQLLVIILAVFLFSGSPDVAAALVIYLTKGNGL